MDVTGADRVGANDASASDAAADDAASADARALDESPTSVVTLPVAARDLVYDARRGRLYASVTGEAALYPNTIVVVDPATGSVESTIPIGSDPRALALADDGSTLWVGIDNAFAIRKVTLPTGGAQAQVGPLRYLPVRPSPLPYSFASSMVVLPGAPSSVAVALGALQTEVLDDGVPRPTFVSGTNTAPPLLIPGPPGFILGLDGSTAELCVLPVTPSGISLNRFALLNGVVSQTGAVFSNGRLYASQGEVVDLTNPTTPVLVDHLPFRGSVALRDAQHLMMLTNLFTATSPTTSEIRLLATQGGVTQTGVVHLPPIPDASPPTFSHLVYSGGDSAAFILQTFATGRQLKIVHASALARPDGAGGVDAGTAGDGGGGGAGSGGQTSGSGGAGGSGGDLCAGCSVASVPAYGRHMAYDRVRNRIYIPADKVAALNKNTFVTVDPTAGTVVSAVPIGTNPMPVAMSDDGSTAWVGLTDEHAIQSITLGTTPVAGPKYPLPTLGVPAEAALAASIVVLPGTTTSVAVAAGGMLGGTQSVFVLDAGVLRPTSVTSANSILPAGAFLVAGPPGILFGFGVPPDFDVLRVTAAGITQTRFPDLISGTNIRYLIYAGNRVYANDGPVMDVSNPDAPVRAGSFDFIGAFALRSATRAIMLQNVSTPGGVPILRVLDTDNFSTVATATLPANSPFGINPSLADMVYLGGDAVAVLSFGSTATSFQLQILHASIIGSPP